MNRSLLLEQLQSYQAVNDHEDAMRRQIIAFVESYENCADRNLSVGHLTGSAWVISESGSHALLTHHRKLNLWVQLGGHVEGDADMLGASLREAKEESGIDQIAIASEHIFDLDVHEIPARKNEPAHFHYDIRYLFKADHLIPLVISSESKDLVWFPLDEIPALTNEESVLRMVRKTQSLYNA